MRTWCKILPFFIIEWFSRKHLMRMRIGNGTYVMPFGGGQDKPRVLIEVDVNQRIVKDIKDRIRQNHPSYKKCGCGKPCNDLTGYCDDCFGG